MDKVSVVVTHWHQDAERSRVMRESMLSLVATAPEAEIIVVDNGGSMEDSRFLLDLTETGKVACYIRNRHNLYFGYARNQAIKLSTGEYLVVADNDILYNEGWLEGCLAVLEAHPERRLLASPFDYPTPVMREKYHQGQVEVGETWYNLSMRAGSNCTVMRRKDFDEIGWYEHHRIAGTKWTDASVRAGYLCAVVPSGCVDAGLRKGYDFNQELPHQTP